MPIELRQRDAVLRRKVRSAILLCMAILQRSSWRIWNRTCASRARASRVYADRRGGIAGFLTNRYRNKETCLEFAANGFLCNGGSKCDGSGLLAHQVECPDIQKYTECGSCVASLYLALSNAKYLYTSMQLS